MQQKHKALICLGSNVAEAAARICDATDMLRRLGEFDRRTPAYPTAPEYNEDTEAYLNCLIELTTCHDLESLTELTKSYQTEVRSASASAPLIAIDIDIVVWDGEVLRNADFSSAYFRKGLPMLRPECKSF